MLQKLRSRHPVDIPADGFGRRWPTLVILGGLATLAVALPLGLALSAGVLDRVWTLPIVAGFGLLALVLIVAGIRGKPGHAR